MESERERSAELMAVQGRADADWPHWPGRMASPKRDRLARRLFAQPSEGIPDLTTELREARAAIERLKDEVDRLSAARAPSAQLVHLLFAAGAGGYRLVEGSGPAPRAGERLRLDLVEYEVAKVAGSPLPGDRRPCAYLVRVARIPPPWPCTSGRKKGSSR